MKNRDKIMGQLSRSRRAERARSAAIVDGNNSSVRSNESGEMSAARCWPQSYCCGGGSSISDIRYQRTVSKTRGPTRQREDPPKARRMSTRLDDRGSDDHGPSGRRGGRRDGTCRWPILRLIKWPLVHLCLPLFISMQIILPLMAADSGRPQAQPHNTISPRRQAASSAANLISTLPPAQGAGNFQYLTPNSGGGERPGAGVKSGSGGKCSPFDCVCARAK